MVERCAWTLFERVGDVIGAAEDPYLPGFKYCTCSLTTHPQRYTAATCKLSPNIHHCPDYRYPQVQSHYSSSQSTPFVQVAIAHTTPADLTPKWWPKSCHRAPVKNVVSKHLSIVQQLLVVLCLVQGRSLLLSLVLRRNEVLQSFGVVKAPKAVDRKIADGIKTSERAHLLKTYLNIEPLHYCTVKRCIVFIAYNHWLEEVTGGRDLESMT